MGVTDVPYSPKMKCVASLKNRKRWIHVNHRLTKIPFAILHTVFYLLKKMKGSHSRDGV